MYWLKYWLTKLILRILNRGKVYSSASALMRSVRESRINQNFGPGGEISPCVAYCEYFERFLVHRVGRAGHVNREKVVLYLHGGAFFRPPTKYHWRLVGSIAQASGSEVLVPLYPLAPEASCRDTVNYVVAFYHSLVSQGRRVIIMGDSAGGGLALSVSVEVRKRQYEPPIRLVLISPWVDLSLSNPAIPFTKELDPMLAPEGLQFAGQVYAGSMSVESPMASPALADVDGLSPVTMFIAGRDILSHDAVALAHKMMRSGVDVKVHYAPDMFHAWPLLNTRPGREARSVISSLILDA